jgi:hypothetical protein
VLNRKKLKICKFCDNKDFDFNYKNEKKITPLYFRKRKDSAASHVRNVCKAPA